MTAIKVWNGTTWETVSGASVGNPTLKATEEFDTDISAWSYGMGSAANWSVSGGVLTPLLAADKHLIRTGLSAQEPVAFLRYKYSATAAGDTVGLLLRRLDASNALLAQAHDTQIHLFAYDSGSYVQKGSTTASISPSQGPWYWLKASISNNVFRADWFDRDPRIKPVAVQSIEWAIDIAKFQNVSGGVGIRSSANNSRQIDFFQVNDLLASKVQPV